MKIGIYIGQRCMFKRRFLFLLFLVAVTGFASVAEAVYNLPADHTITWQGNVGVSGDIPTRSTIYRTLSPSGGDDATAIKTAISSCPAGQVVMLNAGTYNVSSDITVKSGITLRGAGMGQTIIRASGSFSYAILGFNASNSLGTSVNLTGTMSKGTTSLTTSSAHGLNVGDIVIIDQLNSTSSNPPVTSTGTDGSCTWCGRSNGTRSLGQMARVTAVPTPTTFTIEIPLYWNYDATLFPQVTKQNGVTSNAGIEDLTVDNSVERATNATAINIAYNCWFLRTEVIYSARIAITVSGAYRCTIRGSKWHDTTYPLQSNSGYGMWLSNWNSANLIEDNISYLQSNPIIINGETSGNVFSYNYFRGCDQNCNSPLRQNGNIVMHGAHPIMNLYEGNYLDKGYMDLDYYWGSASDSTFLRNRIGLNTAIVSGPANFDVHIDNNNWYYNFIGNVLGTVGYETRYSSTAIPYSGDPSTIWVISNVNSGNTLLRHGNWDSVTNGVVWNPNISDHSLPTSLYLSSKPSWWGTQPWPPIGPDVAGYATSIPAKDRFSGIAPPATHTVTPSVGPNGNINPNTPRTANDGTTVQFTVTPNTGYSASAGGTCGGSLVGNIYTTIAITSDCTVSVTFTSITGGTKPSFPPAFTVY